MRRAPTDPPRLRREAGASFVFVILIFAMLAAVWLGARVLSRWSDAGDTATQTSERLRKAARALEQFASTATRLPCPADPTQDAGLEVPTSPTTLWSCQFQQGTLPWATIGMRRDDAYDAWGWKISYRVYTGSQGSLTQTNGVSMVLCDLADPNPQPPTSGGSAGGLCQPAKNTLPGDFGTPNTFLFNKGMTVHDYGVTHNDAAYVLISHGPTGYGAYTSSGAQKQMPSGGDELDNTRPNGAFQIHGWSDPSVTVQSGQHFDDVLFYRSLADVVKNANLSARDWPDALADVTFDAATLNAALGGGANVTPGNSVGTDQIDFGSLRVHGFSNPSNPSNAAITYDNTGGTGGIGVAGGPGGLVSALANTYLQVQLQTTARMFAVTFNNFGTYPGPFGDTFTEAVEVRLYNGGTLVQKFDKAACNSGQGLVSYSLTATADFDNAQIQPLLATDQFGFFNDSTLSVSEIATCAAGAGACSTVLASSSTVCP